MTLNITVDKVGDWEELFSRTKGGKVRLDYVTKALGTAMWHASIGEVTESNVDEVLRRVQIAEKVNGAYMHVGPDDVHFTREDVSRRIGMVLNVRTIPRSEFDRLVKGRT